MSMDKDVEAKLGSENGFQNSTSNVTVTVDRVSNGSKSVLDAYILLIPLGLFGAHHFYLRRPGWGVLYLFTFGLLGLGWLLDIFRMPYLVRDANNKMYASANLEKPKSYDLLDTWVIGLCPITGLLGFHHYHLGRTGWGVLYTFTAGLFCLGWFLDNIRMPLLVKRANLKARGNHPEEDELREEQAEKQRLFCGYYIDDVYVLAFNPLGMLGLHHFYLKRCGWGTLYLLTFGVFGIGWLVDMIRMKVLVDQKNDEICHRNQHAFYHRASTPHYGTTIPEPQYQLPHTDSNYGHNHGYQPGAASDYRPSYQPGGIASHDQNHVRHHHVPETKSGGNPLPPDAANEYPHPTNPGFPNAYHGGPPPPPYSK